MSPLLEVRDLSVTFDVAGGQAQALRSINLAVPRDRIVGLVGESGSGKSTLGLALLGLLAANAAVTGQILLNGQPVRPEAIRGREVAMVFQDPMTALNPVFTIGVQLVDAQRRRFPGRSRGELAERAAAMLGRVGIADARNRLAVYPHQLSGGLRQRVMIAMALLVEPVLLVADEATTALDVTIEAQIVRLIRELKAERGFSILFVSHSLGLVSELCDEVVVLYAGAIVEAAPAIELFARPRHPYTRALIACEPRVDDEDGPLRSIPGEVPDLRHVPRGCIYASRCPLADERCRAKSPPLAPVDGAAHLAACWYA